jgi:L-lactate dehydrogenase complex protein LldF
MAILGFFGKTKGRFRWLPLAEGWTASRDMPAPKGSTFQSQWRRHRRDHP